MGGGLSPNKAKELNNIMNASQGIAQNLQKQSMVRRKRGGIIDGNDLIQELGYEPGVKLGTILQQLSEAQAAGEFRDRDSALKMARSLYSASNE